MMSGRRYRSRLDKLIRQWTDYRGLVVTRLGAGDTNAAEERRFLDLKGRIAEGLASLTGHLGQSVAQDANTHLRAMNSLLNRYPTLYADQPLDPAAREDFDREWHDHFLFFNKLKGMDPDPAPEPRPGTGYLAGPGTASIHKRSSGTRVAAIGFRLLVLVGVVWALVRFVPWRRFLQGGGTASGSQGLGVFSSEAWTSVKQTVAHAGSGLLGPAVEKYGPETTMVLLALLLLIAGYWLFIRMK